MVNNNIRGVAQRIVTGTSGLPAVEYLALTVEGFAWGSSRTEAFVFPEYDSFGSCQAGAACEKHAQCASRIRGGFPVVLSRDATPEPVHPSDPASSTPRAVRAQTTIQERIHANREARRKREPRDPSDAYADMERRHLD